MVRKEEAKCTRKSGGSLKLSVLFFRQVWLTAFLLFPVTVVHNMRESLPVASTLTASTYVPLFDCYVPHAAAISVGVFLGSK
jgi:hypothetical protein